MEERIINYFCSKLIFEQIKSSPQIPPPDLETYLAIFSGGGVKSFLNGASVDLLASNFYNDFSWKLGASKSTLAPILKSLTSLPDSMAGYISKSGREAGGEALPFSKFKSELK